MSCVSCDLADQPAELGGFFRIEPGDRFVEHQKFGLGGERDRDAEPALGAIGQFAGTRVHGRRKRRRSSNAPQRSAVAASVARAARVLKTELEHRYRRGRERAAHDVFDHGDASGNIVVAWNVRTSPSLTMALGFLPTMLCPLNRIAPDVGRHHAADDVEAGGLAGAVRTDQPDDLVSSDRETKRPSAHSIRRTGG